MAEPAQEMYELLKDIVNAADAGEPYTEEELKAITVPVMERARVRGITGQGEE